MSSRVRVADYMMQAVKAAGVRHVFMLPGGGAMHLNDALAQSDIEFVACHHEQACGIAAEAYGRISENLGVAMVTTGPGATNIVTPVAGAWIESSPLLVISGQVKRADRLRGAPVRQKGVQEVDIVPMIDHVTKYAVTVEQPEAIRYHLEKAIHLACSGRRGPVWIDVPLDVQAAMVDPEDLPGFQAGPADYTAAVPQEQIDELLALLRQSQRPLILAGHGVRLAGGAHAFVELVERLGVPAVMTWNAMDLLPFDHPLCAGRPGVVALRAPNFAIQSCDLLIAVGCRLDNVVTAYDPRNFAPRARKVVVDIDANEMARHEMHVDVPVQADARDFLESLLRAAPAGDSARFAPWLERIAHWKRSYPVIVPDEGGQNGRMSHYEFVQALSDAVPANTLIATGSSGLAVEVFYANFRNAPGQRVFLTSGLGAMGYGLAAGIGACLANARKPTLVAESDGSLMLNLQELATLKSLSLPIVLVVMNNNGYASIRNTQRNYFDGRFIGTGADSGLLIPDLLEVARAFGLDARRVTKPEEVAPAVRESLASGCPVLIDVHLAESEALMPKVAALPQPDGSMLSMPLEDMSPLLPLETLEAEMGPASAASKAARGLVQSG